MTNSRKDASDLLAQMSKKGGAKDEEKAKVAGVESTPRDGVSKAGAKKGGKAKSNGAVKASGKARPAKAKKKVEVAVDPLAKQPKEQLNTTVDPRVKEAILTIQLDVKRSGAKKPKMGEVIEQAVFSLLEARGLAVD